MIPRTLDLNLDAGESLSCLQGGSEEQLYQCVSSVNIACGGHAGDEQSMTLAILLAKKYNLSIGAHPSFPDTENFGRTRMQMPDEDLFQSLRQQVDALQKICSRYQVSLKHIKAHGALYNLAANDFATTQVLIRLARGFDKSVKVVTLAGSKSLQWLKEAGISSLAEGFVDRTYEADGTLRARALPNALITDPLLAAKQAVELASSPRLHIDTLCIHGDSAGSLDVAKKVREKLLAAGIQIHA